MCVILRNVDDVVQERRRDRRPWLHARTQANRPLGDSEQMPEIVRSIRLESMFDFAKQLTEHRVRLDAFANRQRDLGSTSVNVDPTPIWLSTRMSPSIARAN